jgi:signal transduction histidine kinase/ActR/RegA family two-component response regulator
LYPVLDRNKQCEAIVVFAADITERKQTEDELRDSRIFLNSIIECSPNSMWISDEHGTMMRMNQACRDKLHLRDEEVVGKYNVLQDNIINQQGFMPLVKDVFEKGVIARFVTSYDTSAVKSLELDQITRLDLDISISPILNRQGKVTNAIIQHTDITELKQTEAELMRHRNRLEELVITRTAELEQAKDAAEKANLAKSDFLSSMSHELRTPLNAILGFAQLMESESPPPTPVQKEGINEILHSGWHLLILINEILDLAKVESGHAPLSLEPVLLAEVLLECQKMIGPQAQQRCITVTFPVLDKSSYIRADRIRLKQVLINLLSNAIKYNSKQGKIEVICTESKPRRIRVSIKDSGAGLNPEQLSQLFQPFSRLGQEAGAEEGTGIGLVVAKRLVELMGGNMGVESTVGTGSTFWFELISVAEPHLSVEEVDPAELIQPVVSREAQLHTVLYVEDNPSNLKLVKQIIARHSDMRLLTAVDGLSGIEIARKSQPDVILMDINMPGMNGYKALEILKSDPTTAHIPVLALTANAMPRDIKKGMEAGFFRYITKPIMVNELMEALNVALESAEH